MKSKRTKALQISMKTKKKVWERQQGRSVVSNKPITVYECCCHVVPKSKGGLGIEENIVGMTQDEHRIFDNNLLGSHKEGSQSYKEKIIKHLQAHYPNWSEDNLIYKKYA